MKIIESAQNKELKNLLKLQKKSRERRKQKKFVIEGQKEITMALNSNYRAEKFFIDKDKVEGDFIEELSQSGIEIVQVLPKIYKKIAYRSKTEGLIGIFKAKEQGLNNLTLSEKPLILIAEAPEKPGNIGALLRTADAAAADAVIIANPKTDLFNPNIIRSSVGCLFSVQTVTATSAEIITYLKVQNIEIYATTLQNSNSYLEVDFTKGCALVVGTEHDGLSEAWRKSADQNIIIPMRGQNDSLNVSVSAGIFLFEARRQRDNCQ